MKTPPVFIAIALAGIACTPPTDDPDLGQAPDDYVFSSRFEVGQSSVAYSGQTFRQVLVVALKQEIAEIQSEIDAGSVFTAGEVRSRLQFYYEFDGETAGALEHGVFASPAPLQSTWADIAEGKDLRSKIAGNDEIGQHHDWSSEFVGWGAKGSVAPDTLVGEWMDALDSAAVAHSSGVIPTDPSGAQIPVFYVSANGLDYAQLLEKFLLGAVNFSQGADDYLDDDVDGKGLLAVNSEPDDEGKPYSALEHHWDEAFGYWGAARDYLDYSDDEIAGKDGRPEYATGAHDVDGDGFIDLGSEINFGAAVNAAKRDRESHEDAQTDFSGDTMRAFLRGRHIIASAEGDLDEDQFGALVEQRDAVVLGWERTLAATAVHYFNETLRDMGAGDDDFVSHAKHWGELKGFLLALQFNPHSPLADDELEAIHGLVGMGPVSPDDAAAAEYRVDLAEARDRLGAAYGFDTANLGDATGTGGW
jgi:hypothetical protein